MDHFSTSDGVRLAYVVDDFTDPWTSPETLVLLHAAMGSSRRLYAWVPKLARDVIELIEHLGVDTIHLAGSSAGAIISMKVAIDYPDRILTLADFASTPGLKPSNVDAGRWIAHIQRRGVRGFLADTIADRFDLARVDPRFVEWFLDESGKTSAEWLARFVPLMRTLDLTDDLAKIRCPMLAVVPDHDPISSMAQYEVIRDRVSGVKFVVYHGLPHNITDAVPDRCAEELHRFLLEHRR